MTGNFIDTYATAPTKITKTKKTTTKTKKTTSKTKNSAGRLSLDGKIYCGGGKGGDLSTEITIHFNSNGKCICTSDFYQAYHENVSRKGIYSVKGNIVTVKIPLDG